jgi:drug/metabolite transporter (DMT)-like permease
VEQTSRYHDPVNLRVIALTLLALIAFASNSILTRMALAGHEIDAASFTLVRLAAGALMLALLAGLAGTSLLRGRGAIGPIALFAYAAPFSFAYLRIGAAVGALVLFGIVQLTMIGWGLIRGERPATRTWGGLILAAAGLAGLTLPSATRPDPLGVALMAVAGVAWGIYSLAGRSAGAPLAATAANFLWSVPLAVLLAIVMRHSAAATPRGLLLAILSGAVTSGLGYAIWYRALRGLSATQAAAVQLSVPVLAALGAVTFLGESLTQRLLLSGAAVLAGVALVLSGRSVGGSR